MKDNLNNGNITVSHLIFITYLEFYIHPHYRQTAARTETTSLLSRIYLPCQMERESSISVMKLEHWLSFGERNTHAIIQ
jgi:hypothetical protein